MKIFEKYLTYVLLAATLIILGGVFIAGCNYGKKTAPPLISVETLSGLQSHYTLVRAAIKKASDIEADLGNLKAAVKVQAATVVRLKASLDSLGGGGAAQSTGKGWSKWQDKYLIARFRQNPDSLYYTMATRPLKIQMIEDLNNNWTVTAWDLLAKRKARVDSLDIQRNKSWSPPKAWYKKLGTFMKYTGVAVISGGAGYLVGKAF